MPSSSNEILSTRIILQPIEKVWEAWSNPQHLAVWWGPAGFTNTFETFEFHVGGTWKFVMHGPDKGHYQNECIFKKIEPPHYLEWQRVSKPLFKVIVQLNALNENQTEIIFRMLFDTEEECNKIKRFAVVKNEENFDRLEEELNRMG